MPSKSKKQADFMRAAAHNPKFAKKAGIKPGVAKEFYGADKKKGKYRQGGLAQAIPGGNVMASAAQGAPKLGVTSGNRRNGLLDTSARASSDANRRLTGILRRARGGKVKKRR